MRRSPEIVILIVLLLLSMAGVLWYVFNRRAKMHAQPQPPAHAMQAVPAPTSPTPPPVPSTPASIATPAAPPVDLAANEGKTIDFSNGKPVVKDSAADKAAIDAALKDMAAAANEVSFAPDPKKPAPAKK